MKAFMPDPKNPYGCSPNRRVDWTQVSKNLRQSGDRRGDRRHSAPVSRTRAVPGKSENANRSCHKWLQVKWQTAFRDNAQQGLESRINAMIQQAGKTDRTLEAFARAWR